MYKHAENALKERGYAKFFIWVFTQNPRARRFYEAMGFKTDGGSKMLNFGISLEVIRYRKELKNAEPVASAYGILSMPPLSRNVLLITELTSHHRH